MSAIPAPSEPAEIGVIGGTGLYRLLEEAEEFDLSTPYGEPSDKLTVGTVADRRVAFLPRHGRGHSFAPHRINYRANLWALRAAGVRRVLAPCAVGSLRREPGPGTIVVPDQVVDRTAPAAGPGPSTTRPRCTCRSPTPTATQDGPRC